MAGIRDVSQIYTSTSKKITGKISFKIGDNFAAKILSRSEDGKGIVLRTIDGWQFPAILEEPIDLLPELLVKFQVLGYDNGEIKLKLVPKDQETKSNEEQSLLEIAKSNNLEEEDFELLKSMTTFSIPLEKENISKVKTLVDFQNKINKDPNEIDEFIFKYLKGKQISNESNEGEKITNTLRHFFEEFKKMTLEELLLFQENEIQLTEDNIKSYKDIFNKPQGIKESLETITNTINSFVKEGSQMGKIDYNGNLLTQEQLFIDEDLSDEFVNIYYKDLELVEPEINDNFTDVHKDILVKSKDNDKNIEGDKKVPVLLSDNFDEKLTETITKKLSLPLKESEKEAKLIIKEEVIPKVFGKIKEGIQLKGKIEKEEVVDFIKKELRQNPELKSLLEDGDIDELLEKVKDSKEFNELTNVKRSSTSTSVKVMEEVKDKVEELKTMVKTIIDAKDEFDSKAWNGILNNVKANINDIKLFNAISGEYYYLDVPIKFKENDYPCKLIIKDDRKKGKKIDSNNVKMAVSVSTVKMGKIDIYLDVKERNMKLDFKCEEQWVDILDLAKEKLIKILARNNYNVAINVSEREKEMNLANCREFFQDTQKSNINVVV